MMRKDVLVLAKWMSVFILTGFVCIATACGSPSNIREEIQKYEWTDLYQHEHSYEETCDVIFVFLSILTPGKNTIVF